MNAATLFLWLFTPPEHALYKNILSTPVQVTSAAMTCRIILNLRKYGKKEVVAADGRTVTVGVASSMGTSGDKAVGGRAIGWSRNDAKGKSIGRSLWSRLRLPQTSTTPSSESQGTAGMTFAPREHTPISTFAYSQSQSAGYAVDESTTRDYGDTSEYATGAKGTRKNRREGNTYTVMT